MPAETCTSEPILIGDFRYFMADARLKDADDQDVFLRPQSALVLNVLARNLGEVVGKNDLIAEVWQHISVTDDSLTQCIADIRRAIGDKNRTLVKTLPKRGYLLEGRAQPAIAPPSEPATLQASLLAPSKLDVDLIADRVGAGRVPIVLIEALDSSSGTSALLGLVSTTLGRFRARLRPSRENTVLVETENVSHALQLAMHVKQSDVDGVFRLAVDLCDVKTVRDDLTGPSVQKIVAQAAPREILATQDIQGLALDELDCVFEDLGDRKLGRNTVRLYRLHPAGSLERAAKRSDARALLPTIAVIPFEPRVPGENALLGEVVAEDVISALSRSSELSVTSRLSTRAFSMREASLAEVGFALRADYVLSGSFIETGDRIILNVELSAVKSGQVLWTERLECKLADVLQDLQMVHQIVSHVRRSIVLSEIRQAREYPLVELSNHNLLLGAVGLMHRMSAKDFETARLLLNALVERVPNQPAPLAWRARWHVLRVQQGWSDAPRQEAEAALASSQAALDIDPENSLALASEGMVLTNLSHRLDDAEDRYNTALEFNPSDAYGSLLRGTLYGFQGKGQAAKEDTDRALHLAPLDPHRFFFLCLAAGANFAAGDYDKALSLAETSLRMNRTHTSTLRVKIVAQLGLGQGDAARETAQTLMKLQPNLRVSEWFQTTPSREFEIGKQIASMLKDAGVPD